LESCRRYIFAGGFFVGDFGKRSKERKEKHVSKILLCDLFACYFNGGGLRER
jgi:hypothetical protein